MTAPFHVSVYDSTYTRLGQVPDYISVQVGWDWLSAGSGELVVAETDPLAQALLQAGSAPVLVVADVAGQRWSGRVAETALDFDAPAGTGTITATLVGEWAWLQYMLASQSGSGPVTTTMPQYDTRTGPIGTIAAAYINAAAARLGAPVLALPPDSDTSQGVTLNARMGTLSDLLTGPLQAAGIACSGTVWLPGDDQPAGQHLTAPTVLFTLEQTEPKPWLRWSRAKGGIVKGTLKASAATGYRAVLGLNTPTADTPATRQYDSYTDPDMQASQGQFALPEVYVDATDAALGADSQAKGAQELSAHRPTVAASVEVVDGAPWTFGRDYFPGDLAGLEVAGVSFAERITRVTVSDDRANGFTVTPTVGDLSVAAPPDERMVRALASIAMHLHALQAGR